MFQPSVKINLAASLETNLKAVFFICNQQRGIHNVVAICKEKYFFFFEHWIFGCHFLLSLLIQSINSKSNMVQTDSSRYNVCVILLIKLLERTEIAVSVGTGLE